MDPVNDNLLEVRGLKTHFFTDSGTVKAVDGVDFRLRAKETLGMVGESGCGKSVTALSIMRLISSPGKIVEGEILFRGENLLAKSPREMRAIRGNQISMIFQEPMTSLNPVHTIGDQIAEAVDPAPAPGPARSPAQGRRDARAGRHPDRPSSASASIPTSSRAACASAS